MALKLTNGTKASSQKESELNLNELKKIGPQSSTLAQATKALLEKLLENQAGTGDSDLSESMKAVAAALVDAENERATLVPLLTKIASRGTPADDHLFCTMCGSSREHIAALKTHLKTLPPSK